MLEAMCIVLLKFPTNIGYSVPKCILLSLKSQNSINSECHARKIALKETPVLQLLDNKEYFLRTKLEVIT